MKTMPLFALVLMLLCAGGPGAVRAQEQQPTEAVSFDLFYDALEPYGDWISVDGYGFCWRPEASMEDPNWRPYTVGNWAWTGGGWTWVSQEEFGWAVYHYGRWVHLDQEGWVWVPGYDWAPAWVAWRSTEDRQYVGWAPLPPEAEFDPQVGFSNWVDRYYDIGPDYYTFVTIVSFGDRRMADVCVPRHRNVLLMTNSVNVTNIYYHPTVVNHLFVGGPDYEDIRHHCRNEIPMLRLERNDRIDYDRLRYHSREYSGDLCRTVGGSFIVAAPNFHRHSDNDDRRPMPHHVKAEVQAPQINRGWSGPSKNPNLVDALRDKIHGSHGVALPKVLPAKAPVKPGFAVGRPKDNDSKPGKPNNDKVMVRPAKPVLADDDAERRARQLLEQQMKKKGQDSGDRDGERPRVITKPSSNRLPAVLPKSDDFKKPQINDKPGKPKNGPDPEELAARARRQQLEQQIRQKSMDDQRRQDEGNARAKALLEAQRRAKANQQQNQPPRPQVQQPQRPQVQQPQRPQVQPQQMQRPQAPQTKPQPSSGGSNRGKSDKDDDKKKKKN